MIVQAQASKVYFFYEKSCFVLYFAELWNLKKMYFFVFEISFLYCVVKKKLHLL